MGSVFGCLRARDYEENENPNIPVRSNCFAQQIMDVVCSKFLVCDMHWFSSNDEHVGIMKLCHPGYYFWQANAPLSFVVKNLHLLTSFKILPFFS